jgi:rhodanese-related sulfurtransferase
VIQKAEKAWRSRQQTTLIRGGRKYEASRWRVICARALPVYQSVEGMYVVADLQSQSMCDLIHEELHDMPDGSTRGMIIDPIWKGWVTVRTSKGPNLECVRPAHGQLLSESRILEIRSEAFADDLECDILEMVLWTEEEVTQFFLSGGADAPARRSLTSAAESARAHSLGTTANTGPAAGAGPRLDTTATTGPEVANSGDEPAAASSSSSSSSSSVAASRSSEAARRSNEEAVTGSENGAEAGAGAAAAAARGGPMRADELKELKARDSGEWAKGTLVLLNGLTSTPEMNGRSGVLLGFDGDRARYEVQLANRLVRSRPANLSIHPLQRQREVAARGDELVLASAGAEVARAGTYAVQLDPKFGYDQALERVFAASNEFEVLELPVELTDDFVKIRRQFRKISLAVHPDKCRHPQADAAFRKVYGAFETLSDPQQQRRLLAILGRGAAAEASWRASFASAGADDDDGASFQWWWEASVPAIMKAAEEAEGSDMDLYAAMYVSDGLGGDVDDVRWMGVHKALALHLQKRAIFIDCREHADYARGGIPGAWHLPMSAVMDYGIVRALGEEKIHALLDTQRHALIVVYSSVATPFSRCRAFCRWLLRAGHHTLPVQRFRRLRGGLFGWHHRGGSVARPIGQAATDLDEVLQLAEAKAQQYTIDLN